VTRAEQAARASRVLLGAALAVLAVTLVGRAFEVMGEQTADVLAVVGLALLAVSAGLRGYVQRRLGPVLALVAVLLLLAAVLLGS
jgi:hypothetical protein